MLRLSHTAIIEICSSVAIFISKLFYNVVRADCNRRWIIVKYTQMDSPFEHVEDLHRGETFCGDQFVIDVVIRRNAVTLDHRQSQMDQPRTVGVYFMRDRPDKR